MARISGRRIKAFVVDGPDVPPNACEPLLQRIRWRFVLFNLLIVVIGPLNLLYMEDPALIRIVAYFACLAALGLWALRLYRDGGASRWLDVAGPVLIGAIGVTAGHYVFAFGHLYVALYLHSLYGGRGRVLRNAAAHLAAYQAAAALTVGREEVFAGQLALNGLAVAAMAWVMYEMASTLRRHDRLRRDEALLTAAGRRLLRATSSDEVVRIALESATEIVARDDTDAHRLTFWRLDEDHLEMTGLTGRELAVARVPLDAFDPGLVAPCLQGHVVRLDHAAMAEAEAQAGVTPEFAHGLAVPVFDGERVESLLFLNTQRALDDDVVAQMVRLAHEVAMADRMVRRNRLLRGVVDNSADGILLVDDRDRIAFASPSIEALVGLELDGRPDRRLGEVLLRLADEVTRPVAGLDEVLEHPAALHVRSHDGALRQVEVTANLVTGEGTVLNVRDVTEQRHLQEEIAHQAFHDAVTGLPNRALLMERLDRALSRTRRNGGRLAVALLDLDDFKAVNDRLGHSAGDRLLRALGERLTASVRGSDTVARLGGDEFVLLLEGLAPDEDGHQLLSEALARVHRPVTIDGEEVTTGVSVGVALSDGEHVAEQLLGDADVAMYVAKEAGKDTTVVFEPGMRVAAIERNELRAQLEVGIQRGELRLRYQPLLHLGSERPVGAEALVRWEHPERGLVRPDEFIPLAEDTGLIVPLGRWVLRAACAELARWRSEGVVDDTFQLHVNLSARQLMEPRLADEVTEILAEHDLLPYQLVLEVTETALTEEPEHAAATLRALHDLGVGVAIDDFGTGYASFTYLRRFPVDVVKIDRSFVADITEGPEQAALARAIVRLAGTLHLTTVAEGVEEADHRDLLASWGCDHAQGWLWSPALDGPDLVAWLAERSSHPRQVATTRA